MKDELILKNNLKQARAEKTVTISFSRNGWCI